MCDWDDIDRHFDLLERKIAARRARLSSVPDACDALLAATLRASGARPGSPRGILNGAAAAAREARHEAAGSRIGYFAATLHEHATAYLMARALRAARPRALRDHRRSRSGRDTASAMRAPARRGVRPVRSTSTSAATSRSRAAARARDRHRRRSQGIHAARRGRASSRSAQRRSQVALSRISRAPWARRYIDYLDRRPHRRAASQQPALRRAARLPAGQLPGQRPQARDRRAHADARGGGTAGARLRVLLLQQQLQDHAARVRRLDAAAARGRRQRAVAAARTTRRRSPTCAARPRSAVSIRSGWCSRRRVPLAEHLARHRLADLFLDTLPYNAHTTASDALWAGLPVLTCIGESFAGRVAASLLRAVRLPELVAATLDEYEARALELARDPPRWPSVRDKLARQRARCAAVRRRRALRGIWRRVSHRTMHATEDIAGPLTARTPRSTRRERYSVALEAARHDQRSAAREAHPPDLASRRGRRGPAPIRWGRPIRAQRGPVIGSTTNRSQRNVIGTHSGSYGVYRALAVAAGALLRGHKPDLTNTMPTDPIGPYPHGATRQDRVDGPVRRGRGGRLQDEIAKATTSARRSL